MSIRLTAGDELLSPCFDFIFKAIFTSGTEDSQFTLKRFLSVVIGQEITEVEVIQNEPAVEGEQDKQIRYDIACKFDNGELANVEMNLSASSSEPQRLEYYVSRLLLTQEVKGKLYKDLKNTYQITMIVDGSICKDDKFLHKFKYYDEVNDISLKGVTQIITMEMCKLKNRTIEELTRAECWAMWFKYANDPEKRELINELIGEEEGLEMATKTLLAFSKTQEAKIRAMWKEKAELDYRNDMLSADEEGFERGIEQGKIEGIEQGIGKRNIEIAKNMLKMGMDVAIISQVTALSKEEIEALK